MKPTKRLFLSSLGIVLVLIALLMAARALAPTAGPEMPSAVEDLASNLLSGTVTGLDPGERVRLHLEQLDEGGVEGRGELVQRFSVINGRWQEPDLALSPGRYRLVPESKDYVHIPHGIVFQVPEGSIVWRYSSLDFEFLHPEDAVARLGLPLCPEPSSPVVPVTAVPVGTPPPQRESGQSGPPIPSSDLCYANHRAVVSLVPAGLQGRISGLPDGQMATLSLYALPAVPGEQYGQGEPPPADSGWTDPPEVSQLAERPDIVPDWPLVATLRAGNGPWGLVDPSLVGKKYLVVAYAAGQTVDPPAYEVVILSGKALGFPGGVDFAYTPGGIQPAPAARAVPATGATELAKLVRGNTAFAFDLYQALRTERDGNFSYSPSSISLALGMAYAGARGETERQMAGTLHFSLPQEQLHPAFNAVAREMGSRGAGAGGTEGPDHQAVQLPYEGHEMAMVILLPAQGQFGAFERSLDAGRVEAVLEGLTEREVALTVPRFEFEAEQITMHRREPDKGDKRQ